MICLFNVFPFSFTKPIIAATILNILSLIGIIGLLIVYIIKCVKQHKM